MDSSNSLYRYRITLISNNVLSLREGDVVVEDHYRGEATHWQILNLKTGDVEGIFFGEYVGGRR